MTATPDLEKAYLHWVAWMHLELKKDPSKEFQPEQLIDFFLERDVTDLMLLHGMLVGVKEAWPQLPLLGVQLDRLPRQSSGVVDGVALHPDGQLDAPVH